MQTSWWSFFFFYQRLLIVPWEHTFLKSVAPLRVKPLTLAVLVLLYIRLTLAVLDRTHSLFSVVWTKRGEVSFVGKKSDSCLVSLSEDSSCQVYCKDTFQSFKPAGLVSLFCGFHLGTVILNMLLISWVFFKLPDVDICVHNTPIVFCILSSFFCSCVCTSTGFQIPLFVSSAKQTKLRWFHVQWAAVSWLI